MTYTPDNAPQHGYLLALFPQTKRQLGRKRTRWHVALEHTNSHIILTSAGYEQKYNARRQAEVLSEAFNIPVVDRAQS